MKKQPPTFTRVVAGALATGVATALVPPARIPAPVRRSMHVGLALAGAAGAAWAIGRPSSDSPGDAAQTEPDQPLSLPVRIALGGAVGGLIGLSSAAGVGIDMSAERVLVRRGVRHPRVWIGAAAAGLTALMSWAEARADADSTVVEPGDQPDLASLTDEGQPNQISPGSPGCGVPG